MIASLEDLVRRRRRVIVAAVVLAVGLVTVWSYLTPKHWRASVVIRLDPVVVPGLRDDSPVAGAQTEVEAVEAELAAARGDPFQEGLASNFDYPFTLDVERGPEPATLQFTADADSAERSVAASYGSANGFIAWGRAQQAARRASELRRDLEMLAADDPSRVEIEARLATVTAALDRLAGGGGEVIVEPTVPDDPVAPNLTARLVVAATIGLLAGLGIAWAQDRHRPAAPSGRGEPPARRRPARAALAAVAVLSLLFPLAAVMAGVVGIWELRPSTNDQEESGYDCLAGWLRDIADDTSVGVTADSPRFFADHLQEFAFPRLTIPPYGIEPAVRLRVVPGPGPDACGGYHRELVRP